MRQITVCLAIFLAFTAPVLGQTWRGLPPTLRILVETMLTSTDWQQRADAARRLGITGDQRALEPLALAMRSDPVPAVRSAASVSIRQIQGGGVGGIFPPVRPPIGGPIGPIGPPIRPPLVDPNATLLNSWYERYLGRSIDQGALQTYSRMLRQGDSPEQIQGLILGSDEFWRLSGGTPEGFVTRLYQVFTGRNPNLRERGTWTGQLARNLRNRSLTAVQFLIEVQRGTIR
jgi:hypothetical protein